MGVRGLTTFIARNADKYLVKHQLCDTYLILDGYNIACQLYKWHCVRNDCFGGDYDKFAKVVLDFFTLLDDCNITPIVIFDGGYETKKIQTVYLRMKNKVETARCFNSVTQRSKEFFPLFLKELFVAIVIKLNVKIARCEFEADYEIACLAQNLNCPILSYDSDFYIFDVEYIPFSSVQLYRYKKGADGFYLKCKIYRVERFLQAFKGLSKESLPLLATLLGNDYVKKSVFRKFLCHMKLPKRTNFKSNQQRTIISLIGWMQNETFQTAVTKILGRIKKKQRKYVLYKIKKVSRGYLCKESQLLPYLGITVDSHNQPDIDLNEIDENDISDISDFEEDSEESENGDEDLEENVEEEEDDNVDDAVSNVSETNSLNSEKELFQIEVFTNVQEKNPKIPEWFLEKYRRCHYPPYFMDIIVRNKYYCLPQVEDYSNPSSHQISVNILGAMHKILSSESSKPLVFITRNEAARLQSYNTPDCSIKLPKLVELEDLSLEKSRSLLLEILDIDSNKINFLSHVPEEWHLYILGIIYWIKNATPKIERYHLCSILLCMLIISQVDPQVGFCRSTAKFRCKFESKLNSLLESNDVTAKKCESNFKDLLSEINYRDSVLCLKEVVSYFQMDFKLTLSAKMFNSQVVHSFAQLQSCLFHSLDLNKLLGSPFLNYPVSDFYDGTFVYNMAVNLVKRNDVDVYINLILAKSTSVLDCFNWLIEEVFKVISDDVSDSKQQKRRRRKKKQTASETVEDYNDCNDLVDNSDSEDIIDENNKFSVLKLLN